MDSGKWKPIATAPLDNSILILCSKNEDDGGWIVDVGFYDKYAVPGFPNTPGWSFWGGEPLYWMELPQPPEGN